MRIFIVSFLLVSCCYPAIGGCTAPVFTQPPSLFGSYWPFGLATGDFDHDGKPDYAVASLISNNLSVYLAAVDGSFARTVYPTGSVRAAWPVAADFNSDGALDIAVLDLGDAENGGPPSDVVVFLNQGNGTFSAPLRLTSIEAKPYLITAADVDGDGKPDLIVTGSQVTVYFGIGDGTFGRTETLALPSGFVPSTAAGADLNDDGKADVVAIANAPGGTPELFVFMRVAVGFATPVRYSLDHWQAPSQHPFNWIAFGDLNGDSFMDVVVSSYASDVAYAFVNLGDGEMKSAEPIAVPANQGAVAIGDVNQDGVPDVVFGSVGAAVGVNGPAATIATGNGDGTFEPVNTIRLRGGTLTNAWGIGVLDFDGDGLPDILFADSYGGGIALLKNVCPAPHASLTLAPSANPAVRFDPLVLTATVKGSGSAPTGTVSFFEGHNSLGTVALSNASATLTAHLQPTGTITIWARYSGDSTYDPTIVSITEVVKPRPFGPPVNFVATGDSVAKSVALTWVGSEGVSYYEVWRMSSGKWTFIATSPSESYVDAIVDPGNAYFCRVRAVRSSDLQRSAYSTADAATTSELTENFVPGRPIAASDVYGLRAAANRLRVAAGLAPFSFTDPILVGLCVKAVHVIELQSAVTDAMQTAGAIAPAFGPIVAGGVVRAADFSQILNSLR